jgi:hypothetical protein
MARANAGCQAAKISPAPGSFAGSTHMPAIGPCVQVGTYAAAVGRPPAFTAMPRMAYPAVFPEYLQASSFASQAPLLLPLAKTRFSS